MTHDCNVHVIAYSVIIPYFKILMTIVKEGKLAALGTHFDGKISIKEETFRKWLAFFFFCLFTLFISMNLFCKHFFILLFFSSVCY